MKIEFFPSVAFGQIVAPPSKSVSHRAIICASLCKGNSLIKNISFSDDVKATVECIKAIGAECTMTDNSIQVTGNGGQIKIKNELFCNSSASTLRFMLPLCLNGNKVVFTGTKQLFSRPIQTYEELCYEYKLSDNSLKIRGVLKSGDYVISGDISSQFISGLLFALPLLSKNSKISVINSFESKGYVFLTVEILKKFGINVYIDGNEIIIPGNQKYQNNAFTVEGDYSNSSYFNALNYLGGNVTVNGLNPSSTQPDILCDKFLTMLNTAYTKVDVSQCPDCGPLLFAFACLKYGGEFVGIRRLAYKESSRAEAMVQELNKLSVKSKLEDDKLTIFPSEITAPLSALYSHNDHRIAMALSVILTKTGGILDGAEAVSKSMNNFFDKLKELKIQIKTVR